MSEPIELDGLVLAGGESHRMGRDKSLLPFGACTLIEHVIAQLRPMVVDLRVSTRTAAQHANLGVPLVMDLHPNLGPLMGIATGLRASNREWTLVVATDIPVLPVNLVPVLWAARSGGPCVVPRTAGGQSQPLFALYHRNLADRILSFVNQGNRRVLDFVAACGAVIVPAPNTELANLNNPTSYESALARMPIPPVPMP